MALTNLLQETITYLASNNLSPSDVVWVGNREGTIWFSWDQFASMADKEYDDGYGACEVCVDLVVVGGDWWLERWEEDGSEGWMLCRELRISGDGVLPSSLFCEGYLTLLRPAK